LALFAFGVGCAPPRLSATRLDHAGDYLVSLDDQGETRTLQLHLPAQEHALAGRPLLIALHGGGSSGEEMAGVTGFSRLADREGFVAVYPDGMGGPHGMARAWNAGRCCTAAYFFGVDDVAFVDGLIDALVARLSLDAERVYLVGYSNGGALVQRAFALGRHRYAGVGLFGVTLRASGPAEAPVVDPTPRYPTRVALIHGREDPRVSYAGVERRSGRSLSFEQGARYYAGAGRCSHEGWWRTTHGGTVWAREYDNCANRGAVLAITLQGWGHEWPSLRNLGACLAPSHPLLRFDAAEAMWGWFVKQTN
jgi:polyhydroxybutyrate depolymerase